MGNRPRKAKLNPGPGQLEDRVEVLEGATIQHGPFNDRIYVMHMNPRNTRDLVSALDRLAAAQGYGKVLAKIPEPCWPAFQRAGYVVEAMVPGFFRRVHNGLFIAKFLSAQRSESALEKDAAPAKYTAESRLTENAIPPRIDKCTPPDAAALASVYRSVFKSYAFPIHRPAYIERMMRRAVFYFCVRDGQNIVAAAAAETDAVSLTSEMTDFATLPEYRGNGFARALLHLLDDEARLNGVKTAYTIARADSQAMNRVFKMEGYRHAGKLAQNTQIDGRIRSMRVWYKHL